jgi:transcriptional regulator with XRE-family HTH domain
MSNSRANNGAFGALLARRLRAAGLSQIKGSELAGFDHSYFSRLCSGARMPSRRAVDQIAAALAWTEAEKDRALMAAGFLPDDTGIDPDILAFADALDRLEQTDAGKHWAATLRGELGWKIRVIHGFADTAEHYERVQV